MAEIGHTNRKKGGWREKGASVRGKGLFRDQLLLLSFPFKQYSIDYFEFLQSFQQMFPSINPNIDIWHTY